MLLIAALVGVLGSRSSLFSSRSASTASTVVDPPHAAPDKQLLSLSGVSLRTLDPALIQYAGDYAMAQLVFPALITLDDAGKPLDWAAESYEITADGLTYTFHLHKGMAWADGTPIDATTFAYSINRALDPCTKSAVASYLYNIKGAASFNGGTCPDGAMASTESLIGKSIVVADPLTLTLTLDQPASYFLGAFSYSTSWAVPKQLIDQYGAQWTDHLADGVGFGGNLYKVTRWNLANHITLTVNDRFWDRKPSLQKIDWTLYQPGASAPAWADYLAGNGDVGFPPATNMTSARAMPGYAETPTLSVNYLAVNWALAPFDDMRVRNAFSLAIDRKALAHVANDAVVPTMHMIIEGLPGYNPNLKNAAGESGAKALAANVPKARELAQSYAAERCGGDFARCAPIVFSYVGNSPSASVYAQVFQQEWQIAFPGWQITLQGLDRGTMQKTFKKSIQISSVGWGADYPDPQDFTSLLWAKDAAYNQSSVDVPEADALERQADASTDTTGRLALYQHAEQLLVDHGAFIAYQQPLFAWVVRPSSKLMKWNVNILGSTALSTWQQAYIAA
jgi:peptide/nickel transport system substrate-binding protein/oligopeptide transport system substrate-binding protein